MIYFFGGENSIKSFEKGTALFKNLQDKKPDATFLSFDAESISEDALGELIASQGLFEKKIVALFKNISAKADLKKEILRKVSDFKDSQNIFVWIEKDITPAEEKTLTDAAEKSAISQSEKQTKQEFNIFALTESFGQRNKIKLWSLFLDALAQGKAAEEIHGTLFWQAKSILLAKSEKTAEDAGLKPFPYTKAKGFAKNFSDEEIKKLTKNLVVIYHEAHLGNTNFELALEDFALSI